MKGFFTHAARCLRAACVFGIIASCDRPGAGTAGSPVALTFGPGFGDVNVHSLDPTVLKKVAASNPSLDEWQRILSVRVDSTGTGNDDALPVLGTYAVVADTLRFRPRFRPAAGISYSARFDGSALYAQVKQLPPSEVARVLKRVSVFDLDTAVVKSTTFVRAVYPTSDVLSMNLLRMYVEFSAPMSSGRSYDFVKVYAEGDSLIEDAFFTAGGAVELWDPDHTRLTILFDPGRIKRDLKPHEELGLPLRTGKRYRLVIDSSWHDALGAPLMRGFVKEFRVGPQDRSLVRTADWRLTIPGADTRDSFVVTFPEPLDHALLARLLTVRDSSGARVDGDVVVSEHDTRWAFTPRTPWRRPSYALQVETELEDLAGNNLRKLFDVAPGDTAATGVNVQVVRIPFQPR